MYDQEVQAIIEKLSIFEKMYEIIRFIDPVTKKVLSYKNSELNEYEGRCFDLWGKGKFCDNCVSMRAYNDNKTYVKIEYAPNKIYMITAIPYELDDRRIVIELLQDTTNSMIFNIGDYNQNSEIYAMIDNMNHLALKDPLTGVYNRRYINEKFPIDLISTELSEMNMSIILADIDFFKIVNDTYGHLAGDEVLKSFAETLTECIQRETDWVSRFGGEEFLICLPGASLEKAVEIAEKMRTRTQAKEITYKNDIIKITASFGVCCTKPVLGSSMDSFIDCADKKLYAAKNNGRNRVEY